MAAKGFTLLELLVVLALVALALTLVPPMFSRGVPGAELKAAARQVAAGLNEGRSRAIAGNAQVAVTVDVEGHSLRVGEAAARALPAALSLTLVTAESERLDEHRGRIRFFPDGGSTGGRVSLSLGDRTYDVTVDWLTGRVSTAQ
jgi:general secretion pathway protein H